MSLEISQKCLTLHKNSEYYFHSVLDYAFIKNSQLPFFGAHICHFSFSIQSNMCIQIRYSIYCDTEMIDFSLNNRFKFWFSVLLKALPSDSSASFCRFSPLSISVNSQWRDDLNLHITFSIATRLPDSTRRRKALRINEIANVIQCLARFLRVCLKMIWRISIEREMWRIIDMTYLLIASIHRWWKVWSRSQSTYIRSLSF